jgi:hypothetical protein
MEKTDGFIVPLQKEIIDYLFENEDRDIFIKYPTHTITKKTRLKFGVGTTLIFYQSRSNKVIVGDATISSMEYMITSSALKKYPKEIGIPTDHLLEYSKGREQKKALVFHLSGKRRYVKPIPIRENITMAGLYITPSQLDAFMKNY